MPHVEQQSHGCTTLVSKHANHLTTSKVRAPLLRVHTTLYDARTNDRETQCDRKRRTRSPLNFKHVQKSDATAGEPKIACNGSNSSCNVGEPSCECQKAGSQSVLKWSCANCERGFRRESEPTAHAENHAKSHAKNQDTIPLVDVSLRSIAMIENESVKPITKDVPRPDNDNTSIEPEQQEEEYVPPKEAQVCNTDQDPTEETELPSLEYAGESVVVPIPNGTLRPETHNIVDPVPGLTTAPCYKPGPELPEASAVYEPFPPHQEPHPDNKEIHVPVGRSIGQVKEVPAHSVQEACLQLPTPVKSSDIPQRQDSEFLMHPIVDPTFLNSTTPQIPSDVLYTDSGGDVSYIGTNSTAYTGRLRMLCLTGFINGWLPKYNTPLCPCETVTVGVG